MNFFKLVSIAIFSLLVSQAIAEPVLVVTGYDASGTESVIEYSIEDLKALDQTGFDTINDFVEVPTRFSGPLLRDIVAPLALPEDASLTLTALNDYQIEIPLTDATNYDVIVALEKNGGPMRIRENGPLWVIYPLLDHPNLQTAVYNSRMIWQLVDIQIR